MSDGLKESLEGKHTPGPWKVWRQATDWNMPVGILVYGGDPQNEEGHVCEIYSSPLTPIGLSGKNKDKMIRDAANAELISRAPEMLEELATLRARNAELEREVERLRDAELIAWGLTVGYECRNDFKPGTDDFVDTCWIVRVHQNYPDLQIDEWRCVRRIDGKTEHVVLNKKSDRPITNDTARAWLTAAMTAWREKNQTAPASHAPGRIDKEKPK